MGYISPQRPIAFTPLPQRNEGTDQHNYRTPRPRMWRNANYLDHWVGNQLPSPFIHNTSMAWMMNVRSQHDNIPVKTGGAMGQQLGQMSSRNLMAQWSAAWSRLSGTGQ